MIQVYNQPEQKDWASLLARPSFDAQELLPRVQAIIEEVRLRGDAAVLQYTKDFDKVQLKTIALNEAIKVNEETALSASLKAAIQLAKGNI